MQSSNPTHTFPGLKVSLAPPRLYNKVSPDPEITTPIDDSKKHKRHRTADGWYVPTLSITIADVTSSGARKFLSSVDVPQLLEDAVVCVAKRLYGCPELQPVTQEHISLHVRKMPGVAYTAGSRKSKQIHLSSTYVDALPSARLHDEIVGVVRHEMVHALQHDGDGSAPIGLIEGIADWVRLCDGLGPPHWKRGGEDWDDGYQNTAYFLEWLCARCGEGTVREVNAYLGENRYAKTMWLELCKDTVDHLWTQYRACYSLPAAPQKPKAQQQPAAACKHTPQEPVVIAIVAGAAVDAVDGNGTIYHAAPASPQHERTLVIVDQEAEATTAGVESLASGSEESDFDPFPFHAETAMVEIFTARLKSLTYDGSRDARRFVKEFEALVARVNPHMGEEDKRLLLTTAFLGEDVNNWYEEMDLDDDMPYAMLAERLQQQFKGNSRRKMGIIDRDAKLS